MPVLAAVEEVVVVVAVVPASASVAEVVVAEEEVAVAAGVAAPDKEAGVAWAELAAAAGAVAVAVLAVAAVVVVAAEVAAVVVAGVAAPDTLSRPTRHITAPHSLDRSRLQHLQGGAHRLFRGVRPRHPLRLRPHRMLQLQPMRLGSWTFPHSPSRKTLARLRPGVCLFSSLPPKNAHKISPKI